MVDKLMHSPKQPAIKHAPIGALVINLASSPERMAFQKQQLTNQGIYFKRIEATSTQDFGAATYEQYAGNWERKLRPTEVACFLSHLSAWQAVLDNNQPHLILEDDALLAHNFADLLASAQAQAPAETDLITFEVRARKKLLANANIKLNADYALHRLYQDRTGAAGYLLYPSGAKKLMASYAKQGMALADAFIANNYKLNSCQVVPAAIIQLDMCAHYGVPEIMPMRSTIATTVADKPKAQSAWLALKFKWRRWLAQLKMGLRFLSVLGCAKRREVGVNAYLFSSQANTHIHMKR